MRVSGLPFHCPSFEDVCTPQVGFSLSLEFTLNEIKSALPVGDSL